MKEISPYEIERNTFKLIGDDWLLITAEKDGKANTMTASWGGLGVFCGKNVVFTFIRPQRYTKEFVDGAEGFSISVFPEEYRSALNYLGKVSGRDENKIEKAEITVEHSDGIPYFAESDTVILCKKMCAVDLNENNFIQKEMCDKFFAQKDFHTLYIGEIIRTLKK